MLPTSLSSRAPRRRGRVLVAGSLLVALSGAVPFAVGTPMASAAADTAKPSTPGSVRVSGTTTTSVSLAWNASTDNVAVTGYRVWRGDANYDNWVQAGSTGSATRTFSDSTVPRNVTVHYAVRAVDAAGNVSAASNMVAAKTAAATTTPTTTAPAPTPTTTTTVKAAPAPSTIPYFTKADWLWGRVPASPKLDPKSAAIASRLAGGQHTANLYDYGVPIYEANSSTPRYSVNCLENWGTCALEQEKIPLPTDAKPSPGSDGAMVIVDRSTGKAYEFWQYKFNNGKPTTSWGGVAPISGDGRGGPGAGLATGAGLSRLAGVVTAKEMRDGHIPHALVFSTDSACPTVFRYPATKTDGSNLSGSSTCIPEGARVQLDPSVNVDTLPGLTAGERVVARALQQYGAYAMDNGGSRMGFVFETPYGESDPYPGKGFGWDYYGMEKIPWGKLRVLADATSVPPGTK